MTQSALTNHRPLFIAIVGPTGSGKTALGVELAKALNTSVISADSQLVYQGLDIGTGKPTPEEMQGIPHAMIDLALPTEQYTVARYREEARQLLETMREQGKMPIVVGGTGLYVRALLDPPLSPEVPPNPEFRKKLTAWMHQQGEGDIGMQALHQRLKTLDPRRAHEIHFRNVVRVLRALEIIEATGQPVPEASIPNINDVLWIGLSYQNRDTMRARIDRRIQAMLKAGWLEEVESLVACYGANAHALQVALGYSQLIQVIQGQTSLDAAIEEVEIRIHQYARRQLTWYRQNIFQTATPETLHWYEVDTLPFEVILERALNVIQARYTQDVD